MKAGKIPGKPVGGNGTPREVPSSLNPNETAESFAQNVLGRTPTVEELATGAKMNRGNCPGCWIAKAGDGTWVTYRPAGNASSSTLSTTATVELNSPSLNALNASISGKPLPVKLKFPLKGATGVGKK